MSATTKCIVELVAAGALVLALAGSAGSAETTGRSVATEPEAWDTGRASGDVAFPQLPWMSTGDGQPAQAGGLLGPQLETLGPFLLQPSMPPTRFSRGRTTTTTGMRSQ